MATNVDVFSILKMLSFRSLAKLIKVIDTEEEVEENGRKNQNRTEMDGTHCDRSKLSP